MLCNYHFVGNVKLNGEKMASCYYKAETEYEIVSKENIDNILEMLNLREVHIDAILDDSCMLNGIHYEYGNVVVKIPDQMGTYFQTYADYDEFLQENIPFE